MDREELNQLSNLVVGAAIEVHKNLGPGLLEHAYQAALIYELTTMGLKVRSEVDVPFIYKGVLMPTAYRADIIVEDEIILELKATENDNPLYPKQLLTYLRLYDKRLGLLINFNKDRLIDGLKRIVNGL